MIAEEAKDEDLKRLLPCPFCGGGITEFHDNGRVWSGMGYSEPISVSVRHWCAEAPGRAAQSNGLAEIKSKRLNAGTCALTRNSPASFSGSAWIDGLAGWLLRSETWN